MVQADNYFDSSPKKKSTLTYRSHSTLISSTTTAKNARVRADYKPAITLKLSHLQNLLLEGISALEDSTHKKNALMNACLGGAKET
jgi:hypothetical protein